MRVRERKGWTKLNKDLDKWFESNERPEWKVQKKWLSKALVERRFISKDRLPRMWKVFENLTHDCPTWAVQSKILSFITLCLDEEDNWDLIK